MTPAGMGAAGSALAIPALPAAPVEYRGKQSRDEHWFQRLRDCEDFLDQHGKRPSSTASTHQEASLAKWAYRQRRRAREGKLYGQKLQAWQNSPLAQGHPVLPPQGQEPSRDRPQARKADQPAQRRSAMDERWWMALDACETFLRANGRPPSPGSGSSEEARLGRWVRRQGYAARDEELPDSRLQAWQESPLNQEGAI